MDRRDREKPPAFSSNAERLSVREWSGVLLVLVVLGALSGSVWATLEAFEPSSNYRIPYDSSEDYWLFERYCREMTESGRSLVIGDSFVWGQYVGMEETLSSFLNRQAGSDRFVNAGLDGTHPLALEGLIRHYCTSLREREVILHLNLLWVSSPQADLQGEGASRVNHPRLLPQFVPAVPSYRAPMSERLGVVLARHLPFLDWSRHLQSAYFSNADLPHWTLDNPYLNPLRQIDLVLPRPDDSPRSDPQAWFVDGVFHQELPWVELETSLQWNAFQRLVSVLQDRGNRVFVVVGPLNEHMLEPSSAAEYRSILSQVESWLNDRGLPYYLPPALASELYADLSHPLGRGYALLARDLWERLPG